MKEPNFSQAERTYINVMESVVVQEVEEQLQHLPARVRRYLKVEEVVTYALNRLPTLYASSEKGFYHQQQAAVRDMRRQISDAVRQGIMAVQVDPLRLSQPIQLGESAESEAVLQALRAFFKTPDLTWEKALEKLNELQQTGQSLPAPAPSKRAAQPWQPGSLENNQVAWTHRRRRTTALAEEAGKNSAVSQTLESFRGWDDPRYRI
ncbi:MAG: late competence development ComFB family protein [Leptolyngbyaceae cyanobacterium]